MNHILHIGEHALPCREVDIAGQTFQVPRGIARNYRNRSWQLKVKRAGEVKASGNYGDDSYEGPQGSLSAAIAELIKSSVDVGRTLKISSKTTLIWATQGKGTIAVSAIVYNTTLKRGSSVYIISQRKLAAGNADELKTKLVKALTREWQEESGREAVPLNELMLMNQKVANLLAGEEWKRFVEVGADEAARVD